MGVVAKNFQLVMAPKVFDRVFLPQYCWFNTYRPKAYICIWQTKCYTPSVRPFRAYDLLKMGMS